MGDSRAASGVVEDTRVLRFGTWEYDLRAEELRKAGLRVRLPPQPLRVLLALLERPGEVVTRNELRQRLWAEDTFVDFDHGLNAAVKRLRTALGDDAENPRFVETVPLRGYRFIAPLADASGPHPPPSRSRTPWRRLAVGAAVLAAFTSAILVFRTSPPEPEVVGARRVTQSGRVGLKVFGTATAPFVTDGVRLYYTEVDPGGASRIAHVAVTGGESVVVPCSLSRPLVLALSVNGSELLVRDVPIGPDDEGPLFAVSSTTGATRRLGEVVAHDGAWSPDGRRLAYARNHELYLADAAGNEPVQRATVPGRGHWPRWSPDGRRLRLTVVDAGQARSLWDFAVDDNSEPRPLFGSARDFQGACCGDWTPDGRLFVFSAFDGERTDAWGLQESRASVPAESRTRRLTSGPLSFMAVVPGRDGHHLFLSGYEGRAELLKYDARARRLVAGGAFAAEPSRDGQWIVWRDETGQGGIWRSRTDGRHRLQLASSRMGLLMAPRWSPDGSRIAFAGREGDEPWRIHVVSAEGTSLPRASPDDRNEADPSWSPDGRSLMFGRPPDRIAEAGAPKAIHIEDLETGRTTTLPGSEGLFSPRWSPDGRFVVAKPLWQPGLRLLDFDSGRWEPVATNAAAHNPLWTPDSRSLYFQEEEEAYRPIYRLTLPDRRVEKVVSGAELARTCWLVGLDLGGAPLLRCTTGGADFYSLEWRPAAP